MSNKEKGLRVFVSGKDELVIKIGIDTLAHAFERSEDNNPFNEQLNEFRQAFKVTDPSKFANDVCTALCDEGEDGSTPLTRLLDTCCNDAVSQGSEGCEELESADA